MSAVKISVYCLSYNCVNFIEKSIKGMLNQKINVKYKIIIHDDASTDGAVEIIKSYVERYPDKICAILQSENQYSKGVDIYKEYIVPHIEGDYIAICEGDDYWIDKNKLQLQYDYMEKHPECSLCTHNTLIHNLIYNSTTKLGRWKGIHTLTSEEIFITRGIHTSSYFIRKHCNDWSGNNYWFGDYMMMTWLHYRGDVVWLPQIMSIYNLGNPNGVMVNIENNLETWLSKRKDEIQYAKEYNQKTKYQFDAYIKKRILLVDFECVQKKCENIIFNSHSIRKSIGAAKRISNHRYYTEFLNRKKGIQRLIRRYRYEGYFFYPLWKLVMKKFIQHRL